MVANYGTCAQRKMFMHKAQRTSHDHLIGVHMRSARSNEFVSGVALPLAVGLGIEGSNQF